MKDSTVNKLFEKEYRFYVGMNLSEGTLYIRRELSEEELRQNWIERYFTMWLEDDDCDYVVLPRENGKSIVVVYCPTTGEIAMARCSPTDEWDLDTGIAVAHAKMLGIPIPDYI